MMILRYFLLASIVVASSRAQLQAQANDALDWIQDHILCPLFDVCNQDPNHLSCTSSECVALKFIEYGIVPDVLQEAPPEMLKVLYGSKAVLLGNMMATADTATIPTLSWTTQPNTMYTLMFIGTVLRMRNYEASEVKIAKYLRPVIVYAVQQEDADVPSEYDASGRSTRQWLVTNIPGTDIARGNTITPYVGPAPPINSGVHRYIFLVYKQEGLITATDPTDGYNGPDKVRFCQLIDSMYRNDPVLAARLKNSAYWSPERFAARNRLDDMVAGNFLRAEFPAS